MRIERLGSLTTIADAPWSTVFSRVMALVVTSGFAVHAVRQWNSFLEGSQLELMPVLLASGALVIAGLVAGAFLLLPQSTITIDRTRRHLSVEHRRLFGQPEVAVVVPLDDITGVDVESSSDGEDFFVKVIRRSGTPIGLSRFGQSSDSARDVATAIETARRG